MKNATDFRETVETGVDPRLWETPVWLPSKLKVSFLLFYSFKHNPWPRPPPTKEFFSLQNTFHTENEKILTANLETVIQLLFTILCENLNRNYCRWIFQNMVQKMFAISLKREKWEHQQKYTGDFWMRILLFRIYLLDYQPLLPGRRW